MQDISVVIVAFNSSSTIEECVRGALKDPAVTSVVVVDNSSDEKTMGVMGGLVEEFPGTRISYLAGQGNLGFARGCNLGARQYPSSDFVAFLNPDVALTEPLSPLTSALEVVNGAIVAGRLRGDVPSVNARPTVTLGRELFKAVRGSRAYFLPRLLEHDREECLRVDQLDGALMLLRRQTFAALGGFDERFELYYEDVDICRRAERFGGSYLVTSDWGTHCGGVSSASVSDLAYRVARISRVRFLQKVYGVRARVNVAILVIALAELLARTATRQSESGGERLRTFFMQVEEMLRPGSVKVLSWADHGRGPR